MIFGLDPALFWLLIALVLGGIEVLTLSFFLIWPAIAALVVSIVMLLVPGMALGWQLVIFAVLSVLLLIPGRRMVKKSTNKLQKNTINDRGEEMINKRGYLVSGKQGIYRVKIGDTEWGARGANSLKVGDQIRVVGVDGIVLDVEAS